MSELKIEEAVVSIASCGGVRVAFPRSMPRGDLAFVLQGMAMRLIRAELAHGENGHGNGHGNRIAERAGGERDSEAGQNNVQRALVDRRSMPRRKVTSRRKVRGGTRETLECGHQLLLSSSNKRHVSRACPRCVPSQ